MSRRNDNHLSAEEIQAFLEGDLSTQLGGDRRRVEEHLAACARCSAELEGWRVLFGDLASLPAAAPTAGFADRVMAGVRIPRERAGWLGWRSRHLAGDVLQELADGVLPARRLTKAHTHLAACSTCASELDAWRDVMERLRSVPIFAPSDAFASAVLAKLASARLGSTVPLPARPARGVATAARWNRGLALARRLAVLAVPRTRRAWAVLSGVAVTPAAIFGLVFWVVFSHPTLTPQALGSFALWQLSDLLSAGWNGLVASGLEAASVTGMGSLLDTLAQSPLVLAGGALAYSAVAAVALRVLYKNLIAQRRYARVSPR